MDRTGSRRRPRRHRDPSLWVFLLFLAGAFAFVAGVLYPAETLLAGASPRSLVTDADPVDGGAFLLGGTAGVLGSCSLVLAAVLRLARR